ncbi:MAG: hypothetical protein ACOH2E_07070 [Candidatus Paracaedibacter sp.]
MNIKRFLQKTSRVLLGAFLFYSLFLIFEHSFLLVKIDKTLSPSYYLQHSLTEQSPPPATYLVSYAGKHQVFFKNQNAQAMSAINNGIDHIMMFKRRDIDAEFYQKNKHILDIPMGDGMWIWKPYIMLKAMATAPEESIIIYADSPVVFINPITPLINLIKKNDVLVLLDGARRKGKTPKAGDIIKEEFIKPFGIDYSKFKEKDHLWSCFVVVRNNKKGRSFVEQWLKNCEQGNLTTPLFDQSMLLIATYQKPEGVYVMDVDEAMPVIKNTHRHPREEHKSLIPDMVSGKSKVFKISEWGYNANWMQWLRSLFSK